MTDADNKDGEIGVSPDQGKGEYSNGKIWKELNKFLHIRGGQQFGSVKGGIKDNSRCDQTRPNPLCRVQDRLLKQDMYGRAIRLKVQSTGNQWFYITVAVLLGLLLSFILVIYVKNLWIGSYGYGFSQRISESMTTITGFIVLFFVWLILIAMAQASKRFDFKVYLPVPDKDDDPSTEGGKLKWNYYLSTALPMSDIDLLSAEGSKKNGKLASQTVSAYQGALNIGQMQVNIKSALTDLVSRFAAKSANKPSPAVDSRTLTNAAKEIYASRNTMKQFNDVAAKNGITIESLTELSTKTNDAYKYPDLGAISSETLTYADKAELPQNGSAPSDEHWRNDVKVLLTIENPKLKAATERYDAASMSMAGLGSRLEATATSLGYLNDDEMGTAVKNALSKVVVDTSADFSRITSAAKIMIDNDMVEVDALVGFTAAAMDDLLVPYMSKNAEFQEKVWTRIIVCICILSVIWLLWYMVKAYKHPNLKTLSQELAKIGSPQVRRPDGTLLPEAERTYQRAKTYNRGMTFVSNLLTGVMKYVVLITVVTAVCITYYNRSVRWTAKLKQEQTTLESITSVLRRLDNLRSISLLKNGTRDQMEYAEGIKQIEDALNLNILSDGDASARGPYPIAEMVTYIVMATFAAIVIIVIAKRMMPQETYAHMKDLHARAQVGGADVMPVDQSAHLDSLIGEGLPADLRATIILVSLISICYYFVIMIKDTVRYKEVLAFQSNKKKINNHRRVLTKK